MKVRCTYLVDFAGQPQEKSPWLTVGKIYDVLSIFVEAEGRRLFRLVGDGSSGVAIFRWECFEVVSFEIPPTWIIAIGGTGWIDIAPEAWTKPGFWDRYYFDKDPQAIAVFEEERERIIGLLGDR